MNATATTIVLALAAAWLLQLFFSYFQMRRFYRRISELRRGGNLVSIGMSGSAWRRRQYAVLVVDPATNRVRHLEQLSGWTVLAVLRPVPGLQGRTVEELLDENAAWPPHIGRKLAAAVQNAAQHIVEFQNKGKEVSDAGEESSPVEPALG
ncbi:MAG: transcriptional regulator GutM [Caldilineales bacterium]|nr:transcriptional regulator GutM [Caldilineales bacterium]MDW8316923.1 transcriptional regulator GutM [Anaerolineae bacterium]